MAALALADAVVAELDMRTHHGIHPRVGALDVLPFVPLAGMTMAEAVALAHQVGHALAGRHALPVYYYGHAARRPERRRLRELRHGEYEGLPERLKTEEGRPDDGPARFDARAGATLIGAREVLVAYNVWLATDDLIAARAIARSVRESGGGLPAAQRRLDALAKARVGRLADEAGEAALRLRAHAHVRQPRRHVVRLHDLAAREVDLQR